MTDALQFSPSAYTMDLLEGYVNPCGPITHFFLLLLCTSIHVKLLACSRRALSITAMWISKFVKWQAFKITGVVKFMYRFCSFFCDCALLSFWHSFAFDIMTLVCCGLVIEDLGSWRFWLCF